MIDIHIHTKFSFDSEEQPENYIEKARELNVPVIGFSEHYDYDAFLEGDKKVTLADIPVYTDYIKNLGRVKMLPKVLCGIEFGYTKNAVETYKNLIKTYNFDYVINSVHTLPNRGDCYYSKFFDGLTVKNAYQNYFNGVLESVKADFDYQIIGHIGYVSRYVNGENHKILYKDYKSIFDEILTEIIKRDKCLEINSSANNSGGEFLPDLDIIERYLELGGKKLSFGSDAHKACDYQRKSELLLSKLKLIGVSQLCYYENKECIFYDL
jgi:histidinol-phosphatase (PHP family)